MRGSALTIAPDLWERVRPVVVEALEMAEEDVPSYLARATRGDHDLKRQAERLLRACRAAETSLGFLDSPVGEFAAPILDPWAEGSHAAEIAAGDAIGSYVIEGRLGSGGMGVVYLARDPVLDRPVAVKVLPPWLASASAARERFVHEAKAASALEHPNIGVVYEFGETADGQPYMAMAYHEGETLRDRMARGPLDPATGVELGIQLASALAAAHERDIVHCDIKPGNVILSPGDQAKVVDFGAATLAGHRLTAPGGLLGTAGYMSPEQTRGEPVDARTDVWSLGVVLYEMLTGARPFHGDGDEALIRAIRHDAPQPAERIRPVIGPALGRVIARCLAKEPQNRYPNAGALHRDLTALREGSPAADRPRRPVIFRVATAAAVVGIVTVAVLRYSRPEPSDTGLSASSIAVLPFTVSGPDIEEWSEGMVTLLSTGLDGAGGLRAIDSRTVLAQWDLREEVGSSSGPDAALQIARRTGARYALTGSAVWIGPALRLTADVYQVDDAERLGQVRVQGSREEVLELVDRLAIDVLRVLLGRYAGDVPRIELAGVTTSSLPALKAFLDGNRAHRRSDFAAAVEGYERAVAEDSTFALAYYQMLDSYGWMGAGSRAREALELAARFRDRLPARERLLMGGLLARDRNRPGEALELTLQATARYPDAAAAWYQLGENYYHNLQTLTSLNEAEEPFHRAAELEPGFAPYRIHLVDLAFQNHPDSSRVAEELRRYVAVTSANDSRRQSFALAFALVFGAPEAQAGARAALDTVDTEVLTNMMDFPLNHPRFYDAHRAVLEKWIERREGRPLPAWASRYVSTQLFQRGGVGAYLEDLDAGLIAAGSAPCDLLLAHNMGVPVPDDRLESMLAIARNDTTTGSALWCRTMYATESGRWADHARAIKLFRNEGQRVRQENPRRARTMEGAVETLAAYAVWRRGDGLAALRRLEEARLSTAVTSATAANLLFLTGELLLELGHPREGLRYFRAVREARPGRIANPLAAYHMGRAYEKLGAIEEAREAYASFVAHWEGADPELQPLVERARQGMIRLPNPHGE